MTKMLPCLWESRGITAACQPHAQSPGERPAAWLAGWQAVAFSCRPSCVGRLALLPQLCDLRPQGQLNTDPRP